MKAPERQASLFELAPLEIEAAPPKADDTRLAEQLSPRLHLGTLSWAFPGWRGAVYGPSAHVKRLAADGLTAYAKHPLLNAVEVDRSYYEPLAEAEYTGFAAQVPASFRFVVKAHELCSIKSFPTHPRYGRNRGDSNGRYLDAAYATDTVIGPAVSGLGAKLGAILFQFPPQDAGAPDAFATELGEFLARLPKGVPYAVELRNPNLLTTAYTAALTSTGAIHCHNVWGPMPSVLDQARLVPPVARRPLVVRWLFRRGDDYEAARSRFAPFNRLVEPDEANREAIATLVAKALEKDVVAFVLVDNKAEGSAPESIGVLARSIARRTAGGAAAPLRARS